MTRCDDGDVAGRVVNRKRVRLFAGLAVLLLALSACGPPVASAPQSGAPGLTVTPPPGTTAGLLMALDAKTGRILWQVQAPMAAISAPAASQGFLFVQGGYDCRSPLGVLAAFRGRDGTRLWQRPTAPSHAGFSLCSSESAPAATSGVVAAAGSQGGEVVIRGLDPQSAKELWTATGEAPTASTGPLLIFVRFLSGRSTLQGLDPLTGRQRWLANLNSAGPPIAVNGQSAVVSGSYGQYGAAVSRVDLATGKVAWQHQIGEGTVGAIALSNVAVVSFLPMASPPQFEPTAQSLIALDGMSGKELWRRDKIQSSGLLSLVASAGTAYVERRSRAASGNQCSFSIQALDSESGTVRWTQSDLPGCPDPFYPGFATGESTFALMYTAGSATKIVALDAIAGTKLWEQQLPQSPMCNASTCQSAPVKATIAGGVVYVTISGRFIPPASD